MKEVKAAHTDLGKCTIRDHHECFGKERETDFRARPNSVDNEWHFSKGEKEGEREVGGLSWMEVWRIFSLQKHKNEEQGAGLGTEMGPQDKYEFYLIWVGTSPLAYGCSHASCTINCF